MKKKDYKKPSINVVEIVNRQPLLAGSAAEASRFIDGGNIWEDEDYDKE